MVRPSASASPQHRDHPQQHRSSAVSSSIYPQHPSDSRVLVRISADDYGWFDKLLVNGSSLFIVGSLVWVPTAVYWTYRQWRKHVKAVASAIKKATVSGSKNNQQEEDQQQQQIDIDKHRKLRLLYGTLFWSMMGLMVIGPHRHAKVGQFLKVKSWRVWKAWLRFVAFEVIQDRSTATTSASRATSTSLASPSANNSPILAFCPHGIFPFAFGIGALFETAQKVFGSFRPIVATAVRCFPIVNTLLSWLDAVDASRASVHRALSLPSPTTVGIIPGGIAEIFEGYPKRGAHPDEEYTIVRKGFLKMAIQHNRPVVPIYCFGATKMMRRLNIPILEWLSNLLHISLCVFYGVGGLPLPFRQRLSYVMGEPIHPPTSSNSNNNSNELLLNQQINDMHGQFCQSLQSMFDRHKEAYGWGHKTLKIISR